MKLTSKTLGKLLGLCFLTAVVGTLLWAILERLLALAGIPFSLSVGPLGIDVFVVSVSIRANPGTLVGILPGAAIFRSI